MPGDGKSSNYPFGKKIDDIGFEEAFIYASVCLDYLTKVALQSSDRNLGSNSDPKFI